MMFEKDQNKLFNWPLPASRAFLTLILGDGSVQQKTRNFSIFLRCNCPLLCAMGGYVLQKIEIFLFFCNATVH